MDDDPSLPPDDQLPPDDRPDAAVSDRALSLANEAMFTVDLQVRRVRGHEPEDEVFVLRWWADLQFLIVALRRLRRAAQLGLHGLEETRAAIDGAIKAFDEDLPDLTVMRNVGEHIDDYARGRGRHREVRPGGLQVGGFDGTTFRWLNREPTIDEAEGPDRELNIDEAKRAAGRLYLAVRAAIKSAIRAERVRLWRVAAGSPTS
ncbi:MAG TPA: hypothetical protein VMT03_02035 [Polyangia bacterium]|nr:hypothetical protein [Polyangia bacterium]